MINIRPCSKYFSRINWSTLIPVCSLIWNIFIITVLLYLIKVIGSNSIFLHVKNWLTHYWLFYWYLYLIIQIIFLIFNIKISNHFMNCLKWQLVILVLIVPINSWSIILSIGEVFNEQHFVILRFPYLKLIGIESLLRTIFECLLSWFQSWGHTAVQLLGLYFKLVWNTYHWIVFFHLLH